MASGEEHRVNAARAVGLLLGVAADAALGDPRRNHPVAAFGTVAHSVEKRLYSDSRRAGIAYVGVLVGGTLSLGMLVQRIARRSLVIEAASTAVTTWAVLGGSSLADEATTMAGVLDAGELDAARERLRALCGRDPSTLCGQGLAR